MSFSRNENKLHRTRRAFINTSTIGSNELVPNPGTNLRIVVINVVIIAGAANSVKFQSGANDITALYALATNGGLVFVDSEVGWFATNPNEALNINLSQTAAVGVTISYYLEYV